MGEAEIRRIFVRLDGISDRLSRLEGICRTRQFCPDRAEGGQHADRKWLQWLVGALISLIGALIGAMGK